MNKLQAIKTYLTLGGYAYKVIKRWKDERLQEKIIEMFSSNYYKDLNKDNKNCVCKKLSIMATSDNAEEQIGTFLEGFYWLPQGIADSKFPSYFNAFLEHSELGESIWNIMYTADELEKSEEDVEKWLNICSKLYVSDKVHPVTFYYIVLNDDLMTYGELYKVINGILASELPKNELTDDIHYLLYYLDFNTAMNVILALFKMPSKKHYDLVRSIIYQDEILFSDRLNDYIDRVIKTPEDKLEELEHDIENEVIYEEMPFSEAAIEYNKEAMEYLDNNSGVKSTTLVRIPVSKKRDKYKI